MFVSFLQRFGFLASSTADAPLKSRADRSAKPTAADSAGHPNKAGRITRTPVLKSEAHPQATAPRRQDVKAPAKKSKTPVKVAAKTVTKAVVKIPFKKPTKPVAKVASKTTAKKSVKPAPQTTVKVVQPKAKLVALKKAPPAKKSTTKEFPGQNSVAKSVIKPVVKPAAKPVPKSPSSPSVKVAPLSTTKAASLPTKPVPAPQPAAPPVPKTMITPPPALKPGRRSSARTAAMSPPPAPMVPTHAPDAAKASYSTITERVISPPPHVAARKDPKLANNWKTKEANELTDEEVKAMPDSEYMNDKQLAFFRHKLSILKSEIHASAGQTTENLREDTVVVPDPADRATIEEEHALELRTRDRERKLLKKIEQSISRIDAGDYGYCDETGEAIGVGRLIARPTASLSLEAQQRRELKQKLFGD
jgi:DnaK suppressor protein